MLAKPVAGAWEEIAGVHGRWCLALSSAVVWCDQGGWWVVGVSFYAINLLRLDLTHRPTRLEMRLRLAEHMGYIGTIAAVVPRDADWWLDMLGAAWSRLDMPALADLDPTDDTRLPDGARMVDVRALAIVLRYVFGVPR